MEALVFVGFEIGHEKRVFVPAAKWLQNGYKWSAVESRRKWANSGRPLLFIVSLAALSIGYSKDWNSLEGIGLNAILYGVIQSQVSICPTMRPQTQSVGQI